ncbi:cupin-like domain-containing protein [Flavobacteriaceae bacterium TP-CH-4]|uniref:Cupin-like domain-containing protein n=1 Tax=Pelagihabitans pacificus TaxID=2696054 RepID=A0A967B1V9_9FLAO|nr:cupin-like domain-containing protein [Pelagihabitans pacificus]NHF60551.1 cupin-like domain-containing protein [Pelagihabitans pacificus]
MGQFKISPVTRVAHISKKDFVENFYKPQIPVLITGLTKDWPAYEKWKLDYIQERAGGQIVPLYNNEPAKDKQSVYAPAEEMKLYDYIEILKTQPTDLRIFFYNILKEMPELLKDFEYPDIGLKFFKKLPALFFGGGESKVFMHYDIDLPDSMHFHFDGDKTVTLFSPAQTKYLYRVPFSIHNIEDIDMDNPDFDKYPALQYAEGIRAEMKHGDALYMPSGYWHSIRYLNGGFSMTLRALPRKPARFATMLYNVLIMRNIDNFTRKYWGQKWLDYKEELAIKRTEKNMAS